MDQVSFNADRPNRLLGLLAAPTYKRLLPHLESIRLEYRKILQPANKAIKFVYFVESGVASLVDTMKNGDAAEVGTIGNEGLVGLPVLFGDKTAPCSIYVQVPGKALRLPADFFWQELERSAEMRTVMLHYAHAFFNQITQSAACAHYHTLEQRCCRWLMMTRERMPTDEFLLTQEFLSMMLGERRRASVTVAMGKLKRAGLVRYRRGVVQVLDKPGLLARACECYEVTKKEFDRLLGAVP